jgi:hypothetical protein
MSKSKPLSDPYDDDAMLPGEYLGLPGMTPAEIAAEKTRWKGIAAETHLTRTGPTIAEILAAKPGDPLFEEQCRLFDWQD